MPRLRVIKKPEDSKDIPPDQAVQVDLQQEVSEPEPPEGQEPPRAPESQQDPSDSAIAALQKQMEDMKKAHEVALDTERQRLLQIDQQRQEALRRAQEKDVELKHAGTAREAAEYDAILAAMGAEQSASEAAQRDIEIAMTNSDTKLLIDAQRRLSRAESGLRQLEDNKTSFEARREREKTVPKQEKQPEIVGDPIEAHINSIPNLGPAQKSWLLSHRELMTDHRKNARLQAAHFDAEDAGHRSGSDDYFKFLEERLGYRKAEPSPETEDDDEMVDDSKPAIVSAPPSRESRSMSSGRTNNNRITLSPEQREMAKLSGIDDIEYAKQLVRLGQFKKDGHYSQN